MQDTLTKREIVEHFLKEGVLLSADVLEKISNKLTLRELTKLLSEKTSSQEILTITDDIQQLLQKKKRLNINWQEFEKARVQFEKNRNIEVYNKFMQYMDLADEPELDKPRGSIKVLFSYTEKSRKREIKDFVAFFNARYKAIEKMLLGRQELQNTTSISRILQKKDRETVSVIGIVKDKQYTKNNNIMLEVEDPTGTIRVVISKNKPELYNAAKEIIHDEVIGVIGTSGDRIIFSNKLVWPDIPYTKELKKAPDKAYAVFLSDIHVGSTKFLPEEFNKFLKWLNGTAGNDAQREIAQHVKYIFIVGDLVDGIGIYPTQESELEIKDIYEQYSRCAELLQQIPKHIPIIICPGNHDAVRIAEPQPPLDREFAKPLWKLPNVVMVSNPSMVNIHSTEDFPGFNVLLYHGYSFDYYVANVDTIRLRGGYDRADLIMQFLLQRRHLAPTHTSTLYIPDPDKDPLVIETAPDFFITGHIHKSSVSNYRNVTLISGSCWQSKTTFQEKVGHHPEPCRVPIVDLQTRNVKILKFLD